VQPQVPLPHQLQFNPPSDVEARPLADLRPVDVAEGTQTEPLLVVLLDVSVHCHPFRTRTSRLHFETWPDLHVQFEVGNRAPKFRQRGARHRTQLVAVVFAAPAALALLVFLFDGIVVLVPIVTGWTRRLCSVPGSLVGSEVESGRLRPM